jgi:hypothetical protein
MAEQVVEKTRVTSDTKAPPSAEGQGVVCVVDLGEQSRRRVKRLRRGKGRLMDKVERVIEDLEEEGVLKAGAQTVVVVVREEPSLGGFGLFDNDDDDDDDD